MSALTLTCGTHDLVGSGRWGNVDVKQREEILHRYRDHSRRFETAVARRHRGHGELTIPFSAAPLRELNRDPSAREVEVLQLVAAGCVNREIGQLLAVSEATVSTHLRHLLAKLQARSRGEAVVIGFSRGLID